MRFFADILAPKNFKPKTQLCNFWHQNFVQKNVPIKCWWNWPLANGKQCINLANITSHFLRISPHIFGEFHLKYLANFIVAVWVRMLVKLNFFAKLCTFCPVSISSTFYTRVFCLKVLFSPKRNLKKALSYKNFARKMLIKLTAGEQSLVKSAPDEKLLCLLHLF